jgi:hypothetical protein
MLAHPHVLLELSTRCAVGVCQGLGSLFFGEARFFLVPEWCYSSGSVLGLQLVGGT